MRHPMNLSKSDPVEVVAHAAETDDSRRARHGAV